MKTPNWIKSDGGSDGVPIPHSGGENQQLGGYDASERPTNKSNGALMTPRILDRNPSRIPIKTAPAPIGDEMPSRLNHSGINVASRKLRPNEKPPRKDTL